MLDEEKAYYWLEKLNDVTWDIMCINKIFAAEIEKLIKDIEKSILELQSTEKIK